MRLSILLHKEIFIEEFRVNQNLNSKSIEKFSYVGRKVSVSKT